MTTQFHVLREIRSPGVDTQIVEWRWPTPMKVTACETRHMLEMSLPPLATEGAACFPDIAPERYSAMGDMFMRPAGVTLSARSVGGHIQVVRCAVDPDHYADVVEQQMAWTESQLRACLNLRSEGLKVLFQRLRGELMNPGFAGATLVEAYATALIVETARTLAATQEPRPEGCLSAWQHRRVTERIALEGPAPRVSELAQICGVSPRHLLRLYRNLVGESVIAHIERAQVIRAKRLLHQTDLPLKSISAQLGFAHPGSFSTAFRRATGTSPLRYRQCASGEMLG